MPGLHEIMDHCPYCGEAITLLVDDSLPGQDYVEDCEVCCQPISVSVRVGFDEEVSVRLRGQDDV